MMSYYYIEELELRKLIRKEPRVIEMNRMRELELEVSKYKYELKKLRKKQEELEEQLKEKNKEITEHIDLDVEKIFFDLDGYMEVMMNRIEGERTNEQNN